MAAVTAAAAAARVDATRLRREAQDLKLALRGNLVRSREGLGRAHVQAESANARRAIPLASPWSGLEWCREDEELERVLVPLD